MTDYVIIGNSMAAHSAARTIHSIEPESPITFITDEPQPFYSRCALMYVAMDHCDERDIYIADDQHYRELNSTVVHDRVTGVDIDGHELTLQSGDTHSYDRLLITTGAAGRKLGVENEDTEGIYDFISLEDVDAICSDVEAGKVDSAIVIGGGLIGAEIAEVLNEHGVRVDFLIRAKRYLFYHRFCSNDQSRIIEDHFEDEGIRMRMGREVEKFEVEDGRVCGAVDDEGVVWKTDMVVRSIGVVPRVEFLEGSGVQYDSGVLVNPKMETSAPDVWAAGDCVEVQYPDLDRAISMKLWYTAGPQGYVAGQNMAGKDVEYDEWPQYQSAMFYYLDFASYGEMPAPWNDVEELSIVADNGIDSIWIIHDGNTVLGGSILGRALSKEDVKYMVDEQMAVEDARESVENVFEGKYGDRAPMSRIKPRDPQSRRPREWPFGDAPQRSGWKTLTGGF